MAPSFPPALRYDALRPKRAKGFCGYAAGCIESG